MKLSSLIPVATLLLASAASAASVIDFSANAVGNPLTTGTTIAEQYAAIGVHFVGSAFDEPDNPDDAFASNTDMKLTAAGGDVPPLAIIPAGAGNFLHSYSGWLAEDGDSNFAIVFDQPISSCSITVYDDRDGLTQMFAIEGDDILDATQTLDTDAALPQTISVSAPGGFTTVGLILGSVTDWVGVDNVTYTTVPEPGVGVVFVATWFGAFRKRRPAC